MRKNVGQSGSAEPKAPVEHGWLNLEELASVEVSSEDPEFPIEFALTANSSAGWRAAEPGDQRIRILFDKAVALRRIQLRFDEKNSERTQEFTLRWSTTASGSMREILRQQWNFSPTGSTTESEDCAVELHDVAVVELEIRPEIGSKEAIASLTSWRLG